MEEIMLRKSGLEMVNSSELTTVKGGVGWGKFAELLYKAARYASTIADYLPSFRRGFRRGWRS